MATYLELKGDTFISRDAEEWRTEQMTKTLGQIAFEELVGQQLIGDRRAWVGPQDTFDWHGQGYKDAWEAAAQAVRAAVIEECAMACEYGSYPWGSENSDTYHIQSAWGVRLQERIRALKDKQ